jgi:hypothetical protein
MLERFEQTCSECGEIIYSYSAQGRDTLVRIHNIRHDAERIEKTKHFDEQLRVRPRNYNIFEITRVDVGFLKTRGILVEETISIDWS